MNTRGIKIGFWGVCLLIETLNLCIASTIYSQNRILTENFTDGNLQKPTKWEGDLSHFTSSTDSTGNVWLRLDDQSGNSQSRLYTRSDVAYGSWAFMVNLDFSPSASNRLLVQLLSDQPDVTQSGNGYALVLGENGDSDVWRLVRFENGNISDEILSGSTTFSNGGISKVKITRNTKGVWALSTSAGVNGPLVSEASARDNIIKSCKYSGFIFSYTSTRSDKFYLDDISIDAFPAFLTDINVISSDEVITAYSLPVGSGESNLKNMVLDNDVNPESSNIDEEGKLELHFQSNVSPGNHSLKIRGLSDEYGFSIPDTTVQVFWPYHAEKGDIVISEFMFDPPFGLPEYVELFNKTAFQIKLDRWSIGDSSNKHGFPDTKTIGPGEFVILTPDSSLLYNTFGNANYLQLNDWPVLNNGGDAIVVRDASGSIVDSLTYGADWGGNGVSLERKSFDVPAFYQWNWSDSRNPDGGTPGKSNTATADTKRPEIISLYIPDSQHITMAWSEDVLESSIMDLGHYKLNGQPAFKNITKIGESEYQLNMNEKLVNNTPYRLSVSDVNDWFGNTMTPFDTTISYYQIVNPDSGQVFVTEFMYDPPETGQEYIELYNRGPDAVDLKDWLLSDSNDHKVVIIDSRLILPSDQYVVLTGEDLKGWDVRGITMRSRFPALNNGGDQIKIYRDDGMLMDSLQYNSNFGGSGVSLERRSVEVPAWISSNWGDSPASGRGTPGAPNEIGPDRSAPEILKISINNPGDQIRLRVDETVKSASAHQFNIDPDITINDVHLRQREVILQLGTNLTPDKNYSLSVSNLSDYFGNVLDTAITFPFKPDRRPPRLVFAAYNEMSDSVSIIFDEQIADLSLAKISIDGKSVQTYQIDPTDSAKLILPVSWKPKPKASGDDQIVVKGFSDRWHNTSKSEHIPIARAWLNERLLINEIMYNPIEDSHDNKPDQSEYVELYNDSNVSLDLRDIMIHDKPDENGNFKAKRPVLTDRTWIAPHGYVVFYSDTSSSFRKSRLFRFFKSDSTRAHFYRINGKTLSLSSIQGSVYLSNGQITIDSVEYSDSWQNPGLMDTKGRSLERITESGPSNDKNNWTTSATEMGGTPGKQNSVFESLTESKQNGQKVLEITPNPFSPDGDGYQDNLVLSYHLAKTGYRLRVRIFDRFGRLIRTLANGKLAGSSGTLIWNGLDNNGKSNRIGFYIILFEAYGSNDGPDKELKKTVVLARHL